MLLGDLDLSSVARKWTAEGDCLNGGTVDSERHLVGCDFDGVVGPVLHPKPIFWEVDTVYHLVVEVSNINPYILACVGENHINVVRHLEEDDVTVSREYLHGINPKLESKSLFKSLVHS